MCRNCEESNCETCPAIPELEESECVQCGTRTPDKLLKNGACLSCRLMWRLFGGEENNVLL